MVFIGPYHKGPRLFLVGGVRDRGGGRLTSHNRWVKKLKPSYTSTEVTGTMCRGSWSDGIT